MEDQARWMINKGLTDKPQVPNCLNNIDTKALLRVKPKALRLVLPDPGKGH